MPDSLNGAGQSARPREIELDGESGLYHLPLCSRDIAISRHDRIAVLWLHTAGGDQRIGVPIPVEALRDLAHAAVDALAKAPLADASVEQPSE
jgi:hypothetical protein